MVTGPYAHPEGAMFFAAIPETPEFGNFDVKTKKATILGNGGSEIALTTVTE